MNSMIVLVFASPALGLQTLNAVPGFCVVLEIGAHVLMLAHKAFD